MVPKQSHHTAPGGPSIFAGSGALKELLSIMAQSILNEEQERFLDTGHYERGGGRRGYRSCKKPRTMKTRAGKLEFEFPRVRSFPEPFQPSLFDRFQRTEKAILMTLPEMYLKGVPTREVADGGLGGHAGRRRAGAAAQPRAQAAFDEHGGAAQP